MQSWSSRRRRCGAGLERRGEGGGGEGGASRGAGGGGRLAEEDGGGGAGSLPLVTLRCPTPGEASGDRDAGDGDGEDPAAGELKGFSVLVTPVLALGEAGGAPSEGLAKGGGGG